MNNLTAPDAGILLSEGEIQALTGFQKPSLQVRELHERGFARARVNARNQVVLERAHFEAVCRGIQPADTVSVERPRVIPPLRRAA